MAIVLVGHLVEEPSTVSSGSICVEVFRLPRSYVGHEVVAVRQPQFLLPCDNLRGSPKFYQGRCGKIRRRRLVVIVHMGEALLIEQANVGVVPKLKATFFKTRETPKRGLFGIRHQGWTKSVLKSEAGASLPAERARGVAFDEKRHLILWTAKVPEHFDGERQKVSCPAHHDQRQPQVTVTEANDAN